MSHNPYAKFFRSLKDLVHSDEFSISLQSCPSLDQRIYNAPTTSQVAAVWIEDFEGSGDNRNIRVYAHSGRAQNIQYYYGCYDPLQYPLLFPFGDAGWHEGIERVFPNNTSTRNTYASALYINANDVSNVEELLQAEETVFREGKKRRSVSCREYYAYKFQMRSGDTSLLLHTGRLFQQFIVDIYIKVETQRLDYFRKKQQLCRSENFQGLVDSVSTGAVFGNDVGRRVILPSSFIGGPRDMRGRYMDAMSLVQNFGKPDFFLTITCNPNWPEIKRLLEFNDEAQNRPDLVARVFHAKLQELKNDITKKHFFGEISAYTYVIEFQKRGLPHAHFLIILKNKSMMASSSFVDEYVCAEIPNKETQPTLYDLVKKHMVHGPCGSLNQTCPCMVQKKCQTSPSCKSKYPRSFCPETRFDDDSYPIYKRRNTSFFVQIKGFKLDNRWIVPYNPQLLLKFDCHINVEVCATIKSVKYIYKYIYKGHDRVRMSLADNMSDYVIDEIKEYQNARWISPPEAAWRIYGFAIAELKPAVIQLQVHLENSQYINFYGHERIIHIVSREEACRTMLTEFFSMNLANEYAKMMNLLYVEFPCHFVWCKSTKSWKPRKQLKVIGRLVTVNPTEGERYYLRMLLMNVRAPTSFESLKTVNGYFAETFREAAEKLGLLSGDSIIEQSLDEALLFQMPSSLRKLFAMLLIFCDLSNPRSLWIKYKSYMCQDFLRNGLHTIDESESLVLKLIANNLHKMGKNLYDYNLVDTFTELDIATTMTHEIMYERSLEVSESDLAGVQKLNACQRAAFDTIIENVFANKGGIYFVDGPAGTGKTFLYRCLLATVRSRGFLALATATSGIAASILPGGRTAHSRFKLPLDGDDKHICNIGKQTAEARLLKECKLILWDEASMANRKIIESLDTSLKDIMECNDLFGGKVIVFGGITLSTRYDATIEVNPPGQHATVLNKWKDNNLSVIYKTIVDKTYLDSFLTLSNALQQPKCTFAEIDNELKQKPIAWVRGKLRMKNVGPLEYYIGCNYCNKTVNSIEGLKLHCLYCGQTDGLTVRRYKLNVEISDGSTIVQAILFNHDVHRLMLLVEIEMPTTVEDSEIFQQKLDAIDFVVGLRINALNEDHPSTLTYSVACICKDITRDTGEQQATPHARSSNIVEETFTVGNPTKRRLDFDESSKHATDILEDVTSKEKSVSLDKGKRAKVD
ncbi:uncharacterized protein LOC116025489 [Ipomoea triloba]|uniref:uncharacterized protein LOC116025489 n=1 Tax=Ipomoea triloba TaxID=35885 RepID=UPI00125E94AC|nr:uncharacterized protein LOC116025489 [Ipomoea triloba]